MYQEKRKTGYWPASLLTCFHSAESRPAGQVWNSILPRVFRVQGFSHNSHRRILKSSAPVIYLHHSHILLSCGIYLIAINYSAGSILLRKKDRVLIPDETGRQVTGIICRDFLSWARVHFPRAG